MILKGLRAGGRITAGGAFNFLCAAAHKKFNPIEHRLFSEISKNWSGIPLESVELILNYIRTTTTKTGLRVSAELMLDEYRTGFTVSPEQMDALTLTRDTTLPQLNYTISPNSA